jgi:hypothetical protein
MKTTDKIRRFLAKGKTATEIGKILKIDPNRVYTLKWLDRQKTNPKQTKLLKSVKQASRPLKETENTKRDLVRIFNTDVVNHPPHYKAGGIETLDFIEAKDLNFRLGNVVKYVSRAGRKPDSDPLKDLEKAAFYLKREIDARKNA